LRFSIYSVPKILKILKEKIIFSKTKVKLKVKKYISIIFYDDLLEYMLLNLKRLEIGDENLLDPNFLIKHEIILLKDNF